MVTANQTVKKVLDDLKSSGDAEAKIVEQYRSGTSWYRIWSDGRIEQGGKLSDLKRGNFDVTFHKAYKTLDSIQIDCKGTELNSTARNYGTSVCATNVSLTGFTLAQNTEEAGLVYKSCWWEAEGY